MCDLLDNVQVEDIFADIKLSKDEPRKFPMQNFLKSIVEKKAPYKVYVDSWPNYEVIAVKPASVIQSAAFYKLGLYTTNPDKLESVLISPGFLPLTVPIRIFGLPVEQIPIIQNLSQKLGCEVNFVGKEDPRYMVDGCDISVGSDCTEQSQVSRELSKTMEILPLDSGRDSHIVADNYVARKENYNSEEECLNSVKYLISNSLCLGVFTKSDNQLIAWSLSNPGDNVHIMGHTLPAYRRLNLAKYLNQVFMPMKVRDGFISIGYVAKSNSASLQLCATIGLVKSNDAEYVHCVLRPKISKL